MQAAGDYSGKMTCTCWSARQLGFSFQAPSIPPSAFGARVAAPSFLPVPLLLSIHDFPLFFRSSQRSLQGIRRGRRLSGVPRFWHRSVFIFQLMLYDSVIFIPRTLLAILFIFFLPIRLSAAANFSVFVCPFAQGWWCFLPWIFLQSSSSPFVRPSGPHALLCACLHTIDSGILCTSRRDILRLGWSTAARLRHPRAGGRELDRA